MDIQIAEKEYCKLEVKYEADAEQIENKRTEVLSLFKKAPVPGFRVGKANLAVIKIHYKKQIEESLKRALAEEAFHSTIFEKNIKPLGQPDFSNLLLLGDKFTCEFSISKKPDFELAQYKGFEIPKQPHQFQPDELAEKMLEDLRSEYGEMVQYQENDFVQDGDKIILSYIASIDGQNHPELSSEGELLKVGSNPLKDFDQSLLGMKVNETRDFDVVVPENGLASYAGKTIHFSATVTMGSKINKMPLDDSLAQKVGRQTFQELRDFAYSSANARLQESDRSALTRQIHARLTESHTFKVPEWLALSEAQYLAANSKKDWASLADLDKESYIKMADANVKLALILDKIRENEPDAQLSDQEIVETIKQNLAKSSGNTDEVLQQMNKTGYLQILVARLRDEFTLDFIIKNTTIID